MTNASPLAYGISNAEGFGTPNAPTITNNNNPGALFSNGASQSFSSLAEGWSALQSQIDDWLNGGSQYANPDTTILELAKSYTGNDSPETWASNVANFLGVTPDTTLGELQQQGLTAPLNNTSPTDWFGSNNPLSNFLNKYLGKKSSSDTPSGTSNIPMRLAFAVLGLLLIAGGIFGFDSSKELVIKTAKSAVEAGAA